MDAIDFKTFLNERIHEKGISLQKLSELTNIAPANLERLIEGKYNELPPAPYLRGYIEKLAPVLGFNAEEGWENLKRERSVKTAGVSDALPTNRYARVFPVKVAVAILAGLAVVVFTALRLPQILGLPEITITNPAGAVTVVNVAEFIITGTLQNGDTLTINNNNVPINPDGTWAQTVALQPEKIFNITASKFLGRSVTLVRQIIYEAPTATSTLNTHPSNSLPSPTSTGTSPYTPTTSTP